MRPYLRLVVVFGVAQLGSLVAAASIPKVIQFIIDGPISHHQLGQLVPMAGLLVLVGLLEFVFIYLRRNYSGIASLRMETDLRNDFYAHLQNLQVSFHDNWQSGQLLSRAISDIATVRRTSLDGIKTRAQLWTRLNFLPNLSLVAVLLLGGFNVIQGHLTIGGLVAFMNYVFMLTWPMDAIGWVLSMSEECQTASERLNEVLDSRPEISDRPRARTLEKCGGHPEFRALGFKYPKTDEWVLRGFHLGVGPGETVGLV